MALFSVFARASGLRVPVALSYAAPAFLGQRLFNSATNNSLVQLFHMEEFFHRLDKNSDGKVTVDELVNYYQAMGRTEAEAVEVFVKADVNRDGELSVEEVANLLSGNVPDTKSPPKAEGSGEATA
ncbi:hypothetical protein RI054_39g144860 [Pseudoscourfieldia marina]